MTGAVQSLPCLKDLIAVLFECFCIISLGYLSCRFKLISAEAKDLGSYLTSFALPMIIFLNIAQMEIQTINVSFLLCMLIAKLLLFTAVALLTLAISYPSNWAYAGSLSILTTQSNDFALGYPLIKSLYGETRPEMLGYLSLMAPIQLLVLNPLGIVMLEYHKSKTSKQLATCDHKRTGHDDGEQMRQSDASANQKCNHCTPTTTTPTPPTSDKASLHEDSSAAHKVLKTVARQEPQPKQQHQLPNPHEHQHSDRAADIGAQLAARANHGILKSSMRRKNTKQLTLSMPERNKASALDVGYLGPFDGSFDGQRQTGDSKVSPSAPASVSRGKQSAAGAHHLQQRVANAAPPGRKSPLTPESVAINDEPVACACQLNFNQHVARAPAVNWNFLKALATNPLIVASLFALLVNLTHGPQLPKVVTKTANTIAASFAAPALFVVGISMHGKFELLLRNPHDLLLASILVLTKELILPNVMRTLALLILPTYVDADELPYLVDFSYLYGLLPTAPTACIIANQYGVLSNVVSISMLLSTFASAPLMLTASAIITQASNAAGMESVVTQTVKVSSLCTMTLASLTLYAFWKYKKHINYVNFISVTDKLRQNPAHVFLPLLTITQTVVGIGGLVWYFVDRLQPSTMHGDELDLHHAPHAAPAFSSSPAMLADEHNASSPVDQDLLEPVIVPVYVDLKLWTACMVHYIFSSAGLLMARFVVLCIIMTMFAKMYGGHSLAVKVSRFMATLYALMGTGVVVWLILDSSRLRCTPAEPSLPNHLISLFVRLFFNMLFLGLAVPLFARVFRSDNKIRHMRKLAHRMSSHLNKQIVDTQAADSLVERQFVTSCASLSSDSSSAITANTNLDLNSAQCLPANASRDADTHTSPQANLVTSDSLSIILDASIKRAPGALEVQSIVPQVHILGSYGATSEQRLARHTNNTTTNTTNNDDNNNVNITNINDNSNDNATQQYHGRIPGDELDRSTSDSVNAPCLSQHMLRLQISEFNKYSILIVFMLIDSLLNLTSIIQVLSHDKLFGTFQQIEIMNVALDFGQGLLTFLVYGIQELFYRK